MTVTIPAAVGQIWASRNKRDQAAGHNQRRVVTKLGTKRRYRGYDHATGRSDYEDVSVAFLTCEGHGGAMVSRVSLDSHGGIAGHELVAECDPVMERAIAAFDIVEGLPQRARETLSLPRARNGRPNPNPRAWLMLDQDEVQAIGLALADLRALVEQQAAASLVGFPAFEAPEAEAEPA